MRRTRVASMALLLLATLLLACRNDEDGADGADGADVTTIDIVARDLAFDPAELRVRSGQRYELRMRNEGALLHDWNIDSIPATDVEVHETGEHHTDGESMPAAGAMMLHMAAEHDTTSMMTFTPTRSGEYEFYCSVAGHREAGMHGRLIVE